MITFITTILVIGVTRFKPGAKFEGKEYIILKNIGLAISAAFMLLSVQANFAPYT
jgi:hypothetical protein